MKNTLLPLFIFCAFSSCSPILSTMLGIKNERHETKDYQQKYLLSNGIDTTFMANMNPNLLGRLSTSNRLDTFSTQSFTPVQFRVYKNDGSFFSGWEQCFGSKKRSGILNDFPHAAPRHWPLNKDVTLQSDLELLEPINFDKNNFLIQAKNNKYDFVVVSYWAGYLGGLSKSMMKEVDQAIENSNYKILHLKVNLGKAE